MDDRQPSLGLPSGTATGTTVNTASTTTGTPGAAHTDIQGRGRFPPTAPELARPHPVHEPDKQPQVIPAQST